MSLTECGICFNLYNHRKNRPVVGACGHTFCVECSQKFENGECPNCRKSGAFLKPPTNFLILDQLPATEEQLEYAAVKKNRKGPPPIPSSRPPPPPPHRSAAAPGLSRRPDTPPPRPPRLSSQKRVKNGQTSSQKPKDEESEIRRSKIKSWFYRYTNK